MCSRMLTISAVRFAFKEFGVSSDFGATIIVNRDMLLGSSFAEIKNLSPVDKLL